MNTIVSDDDSLARAIFESIPTSESSLITKTARFEKHNGWYIYAIKDGIPFGYIASNVFDDHISVSVVVLKEHREKGVGEVLGRAMLDEMRSRGYKQMVWRAAHCNKASQRLAEKIGGKCIEVSDYGWHKYIVELD